MATKATTKANEHLLRNIECCLQYDIHRLPTLAILASQAGVALFTMRKAVSDLKNKGILSVNHKTGIIIKGSKKPLLVPALQKHPAPPDIFNKWENTLNRIEAEILNGYYHEDTALPSIKELSTRYGVCYRTVRQALNELINRKRIIAHKKSFRIVGIGSGRTKVSIVLIAKSDSTGSIELITPRTQEHLRALERECSEHNIKLELHPYTRFSNLKTVSNVNTIGYIIWTLNITEPDLLNIIDKIKGNGKPITVLDETGDYSSIANLKSRHLRLFSMANSAKAAYNIGRLLLKKSHRSIAYISPYHGMVWSKNRYEGLAKAFNEAGFHNVVKPFTSNELTDPFEFATQAHTIRRALEGLKSGLDQESPDHKTIERTLFTMQEQIEVVVTRENYREKLYTLFNEAYNDRSITAWVGANEPIALDALAYLKAKKRSIPENVAVIGFDDGLEAFRQSLTSYNFRGNVLMHTMLAYILNPETPLLKKQTSPYEVDGVIIERQTT